MKNSKAFKKIIAYGLVPVLVSSNFLTHAQYFFFSPDTATFKQWCSSSFQVRINTNGQAPTAGIMDLPIDAAKITANTGSFSPSVLTFDTPTWTPYFKPGNILNVDRNKSPGPNTTSGSFGTLNFVPVVTANILSNTGFKTTFSYDGSTTKTSLSVAGSNIINATSQNAQSGVYTFIQQPCTDDTTVPTISTLTTIGGSTVANQIRVTHLSGLKFNIQDAWGSVAAYRFLWGNYVVNNSGLSNQRGVNSGTVIFTVSGNGTGRTYTGGINNAQLNPIGSGITWDEATRDYYYTINSSDLFNFGIENTITVTRTARDRAPTLNTTNSIVTFNQADLPLTQLITPAQAAINVLTTTSIKVRVTDNWAGVNTGTIKIRLSGSNNTNYWYSGTELTFSGISGTPGTGNAGGYDVSFTPLANTLPIPAIRIDVIVSGFDLADVPNTVQNNGLYFITRANCSTYTCGDAIYFKLGSANWSLYTGGTPLVVTGGNNEFYTGLWNGSSTGIINCGLTGYGYTGIALYTGAVGSQAGLLNFFTGNQLFFSGSDTTRIKLSGNQLIIYNLNKLDIVAKPGYRDINNYQFTGSLTSFIYSGGTWNTGQITTGVQFTNQGSWIFQFTNTNFIPRNGSWFALLVKGENTLSAVITGNWNPSSPNYFFNLSGALLSPLSGLTLILDPLSTPANQLFLIPGDVNANNDYIGANDINDITNIGFSGFVLGNTYNYFYDFNIDNLITSQDQAIAIEGYNQYGASNRF